MCVTILPENQINKARGESNWEVIMDKRIDSLEGERASRENICFVDLRSILLIAN